jgi:Putative prokaryotic signal transducing protein
MDDLIRVAIVDNEIAAELAVSRLKMEGIHAMWRKTDMASAVWGVGITEGVGGPVEILVLPKDAPRARELLADSG